MPRKARLVLVNRPHHVIHRGNRGEPIFWTPLERATYLEMLERFSARAGVDVWAYCLMTNHVHLLLVPHQRAGLALSVRDAHRAYARWLNWRHGWTVHLWANRYHSTPLDEEHLWVAVRYVEQNPVRAGLVPRAEDFRWSSAATHCRGLESSLLARSRPFPGPVSDWSAWMATELEPHALARLRLATRLGTGCNLSPT
jgi:putative transposase